LQVIRQLWGEVLTLSAVASLLGVLLLVSLSPVITKLFDVANASSSSANTATSSQPVTISGPTFHSSGSTSAGSGPIISQVDPKSAVDTSNVHLSISSLEPKLLLIIVGLGMGLALATCIFPALYVARLKPAEVLRRA
jgi:ABC-type antimicrobial peptide transport system permease subunit